MNELLNLFIYIDEYLIKSLSSVYLNGYIDIHTSKKICDNTLSGRIHLDENNKTFLSDGKNKLYNKGFKSSTKSRDFNETNYYGNDKSIENRLFGRTEEEFKRIYTSFEIHNKLLKKMLNSKAVKSLDNSSFYNLSISEGDFIKIKGLITGNSILSYLDSIISLIESFPLEILNNLLQDKTLKNLNFSIVLNLLKNIRNIISKNSTDDIIMSCLDYTAIINVNYKYFLNGDCYIFDKSNCNCNVLGKVIKICKEDQHINLLRKLTQEDYYSNLLDFLMPYLETLKELNLPIPLCPNYKIQGPTLLIVPISMYF